MRKVLGLCFLLLVLAGAVTGSRSIAFDGGDPIPPCFPKNCPHSH